MGTVKTELFRRAQSPPSEAKVRAPQLEQVLQQVGEAVIVKDLDAIVTYWNREAMSLYGYSPEEAVGQPLRNLHAADLSEADYARILARVRAGKPTSSTTERRKRNGERVRVAIRTTPLVDTQGRLIGEITVARDVTQLLSTEEALRGAQATLEARLTAVRESHRNLVREVTGRRKIEAAQRIANQALAATVRQLKSFHRDGEVLSHMAELLQSCAQRDEAYTIVRETVSRLFPGVAGMLYIYRESRDVLEHVASWGGGKPPAPVLGAEDCWALRLGCPHFVHRHSTVRCLHAQKAGQSYICMPIQGQAHVLGLLHLALDVDSRTERPKETTERRLRALTDRVGPALANLKLRDALRVLALRDGLTGLYNRRYMEDALNRELHRSESSGRPVSIIMIDIDHFKRFNDTFGHDAGDFVLSSLAREIPNHIRLSDMACRYGGEELAIVLVDANLEQALERAEELRLAIRQTKLRHRGQSLPAPAASFGVAAYPLHGANMADLLKAADRALYRAKQAGRDQVCAAESPPAAPERE